MNIKLTFLGAAGNVTGSQFLLEVNNKRVLIDCGFFQGWEFKERNWNPFQFSPNSLDAVLLTHAHLDHCGLLPKLVKEGFRGKILCSGPTAQITKIILRDSAKIQEEDAKYKRKRHKKENISKDYAIEPLYTEEDALEVLGLLKPVSLEQKIPVCEGVEATFRNAGHILGATSILLHLTQDNKTRTILFSGDIGRWNAPILRDPLTFDAADYLLVESTYGNRLHEPNEDIPRKLARVVNSTYKAGGNLIIPSFSVERTQDLLFHLSNLLHEDEIPPLMVFVDSPMAIRVTEVFRKNAHLFDRETKQKLEEGIHPCDFPTLQLCRTVTQSKAINRIRGTAIILAGSGMCTGGRIKHHLKNNIERKNATLLFVGYQAKGTLGRHLLEGKKKVRILGHKYLVKARTEKINGFSGHADQSELLNWCSHLKKPPRKTFIIHGESDAANAFSKLLQKKLDFKTHIPEYQETVVLE